MRHINVAHPFYTLSPHLLPLGGAKGGSFLTLRSNPSLSDERSSCSGA